MGWLFFSTRGFGVWFYTQFFIAILSARACCCSVYLRFGAFSFAFGLPAQSSDLRSCRRYPFTCVCHMHLYVRNFTFYFPAPRIFQFKATRVTFIFSTRNCLQHHNLRNSSHLPITVRRLAQAGISIAKFTYSLQTWALAPLIFSKHRSPA